MKPHYFATLTIGALSLFSTSCKTVPSQSANTLSEQITGLIDQPKFAQAQWGIKVVSLDTGKVLFDRNSDKLMKPASNTKMYTGSLALDRLGAETRLKTSFYAAEKPDAEGKIHGDLTVYGRGDFSFGWRFFDNDYTKATALLVEAVKHAGIKEVEGDLVGDESYFRGPPYGTDWAVDDLQEYYGALASALTLDESVLDLEFTAGAKEGEACKIGTKPESDYLKFDNRTKTVAKGEKASVDIYRPIGENTVYLTGGLPVGGKSTGSVSVHDPAKFYVTQLKRGLESAGVKVGGKSRTRNWLDQDAAPVDYAKRVEVASVEGKTIGEMVKGMMKPSQNLYAHTLLLQVGKKTAKSADEESAAAGLKEMRKFLGEVGIKKGRVILEEGSGLSRGCLLTPASSVALLTFMTKHKAFPIFYDALPIAGVDGSLKKRFKGTAAEKNVHAKTGSIEFVNTISGYVTNKAGEKLVFSVMLNNFSGKGEEGRVESDKVVQMLAEWGGK